MQEQILVNVDQYGKAKYDESARGVSLLRCNARFITNIPDKRDDAKKRRSQEDSMKSASGSSEGQLLLRLLDEAYSQKTWHGPNLKGSLRGMTAESAAWRPATKRHNIWEIAIHAAYWKYIARRRLLGEKRGSFSLKGSNWFSRPVDLSDRAWKEDLELLDEEHRKLRAAVADLGTASLSFTPSNSRVSNLSLICGIANHDIYHAGQIQLLKRLQKG